MIIACGVDPAAPYGIAVIRYPGEEVLAKHHSRDPHRGENILRELSGRLADSVAPRAPVHVLAVEDQWIIDSQNMPAKRRRGLQASAIKVAHRAGEWAGRAGAYGWPQAIYVKPQTWRSVYKGLGRKQPGRRWTKADALQWANKLFRLRLHDDEHDLAEALLIARWAAVRAHGETTIA